MSFLSQARGSISLGAVESLGPTVLVAYLSAAVARVSDIAAYVLIVTGISPIDVGYYLVVVAATVLCSQVLEWGASSALIREFSQQRIALRSVFVPYVLSRGVPGLALAIVAALALWLAGQSSLLSIFVPVTVAQLAQLIQVVWIAWLRGRNLQRFANALDASVGALRVAWVAVAILVYRTDSIVPILWGFCAVSILSLGASSAISIGLADEIWPNTSMSTKFPIFRAGSAFAAASIASAVQNRFDWILVSHFMSPVALATYVLANKLYEVVRSGVSTGFSALFPFLCRRNEGLDPSVNLERMFGALLAVFGGTSLAITVTAIPLVNTYLPASYKDAETIIPLFMVSSVMSNYAGVMFQMTAAGRSDRVLASVLLAATTLQVAANLVLIPRFGLVGGGLGMLVAAVASGVGYSSYLLRTGRIEPWLLARYAAASLLLASAITVSTLAFSTWYGWATLVLGLLALAVLAAMSASPRKIRNAAVVESPRG